MIEKSENAATPKEEANIPTPKESKEEVNIPTPKEGMQNE